MTALTVGNDAPFHQCSTWADFEHSLYGMKRQQIEQRRRFAKSGMRSRFSSLVLARPRAEYSSPLHWIGKWFV
jgi:hypothetical protein